MTSFVSEFVVWELMYGLMDGSEEQIAEAQAFTSVAGKGWLLNGGGALSDMFLCLLVICDIGFHSSFVVDLMLMLYAFNPLVKGLDF